MSEMRISNLHVDLPGRPKHPHELLLRVVGDLKIEIGGLLVYREIEFPVVELAHALSRWKSTERRLTGDFEFESMEASEVGLVWIRAEEEAWRFGSVHQEASAPLVSLEEVDRIVQQYIDDVIRGSRSSLGLNVADVIETGC